MVLCNPRLYGLYNFPRMLFVKDRAPTMIYKHLFDIYKVYVCGKSGSVCETLDLFYRVQADLCSLI